MSEQFSAEEVRVLRALASGLLKATGGGSPAGEVADDADLDGKFGDEPLRKDPTAKYWTGPSCVGQRMSECPPDYLDALAKYKDACAFMNEKNGDTAKAKYIEYDRRDAKRARGWAKRIRAGWKASSAPPRAAAPPAEMPDYGAPDDGGELPF